MSALDYLLNAPDPFQLFGLERKFDVDIGQVGDRHAALAEQANSMTSTDPDKAAQVLAKLDDARAVLTDPVARGRLLLDLMGGAADPKSANALPPGFRDRLDPRPLREAQPDCIEGERRRLISAASYLFRQLAGADNGVVHRERRRQIRANLNAIEMLDRRFNGQP